MVSGISLKVSKISGYTVMKIDDNNCDDKIHTIAQAVWPEIFEENFCES